MGVNILTFIAMAVYSSSFFYNTSSVLKKLNHNFGPLLILIHDLDRNWIHDFLFKDKSNKPLSHLFYLVNFVNTILYVSLFKSY